MAQLARDSKIYSIWEGTTYVQALDFIGRKMRMNKGQAFAQWLNEIKTFVSDHDSIKDFAAEWEMMKKAWTSYQNILQILQKQMGDGNVQAMPLFATRILKATCILYGSMLIMDQAVLAHQKVQELDAEHYDRDFYLGKIASGRFYVMNELPNIFAIEAAVQAQDYTAVKIEEQVLGLA